MTKIILEKISKRYGTHMVIDSVDLTVESGEFVVFVGPSGCGKSTLLRMIAGLETISAGRLTMGGIDRTASPPSERRVAMVFQNYALYPHMTARENLSFGMRMRGEPKAAIAARVERAAQLLQIEHYLDRKPGDLSGGQCQRIAIGRAIVQEPDAFLFDEPLSNLDTALRIHMRLEIAALRKSLDASMIYVTHDQVEAMTLADRIVVLRAGRIEQTGTPAELYSAPANLFVASSFGSPALSVLPAVVDEAGAARLACGGRIPLSASLTPGQRIQLGLRAEHMVVATDGQPARFSMQVIYAERLGGIVHLYGRHGDADIRLAVAADQPPRIGESCPVAVITDRPLTFNEAGDALC